LRAFFKKPGFPPFFKSVCRESREFLGFFVAAVPNAPQRKSPPVKAGSF
jgi:hypothetical protein